MPLSSYSHSAVFTSYSSGLWLGLLMGWLYSIGVLSFCPLLSKTSFFLLKRKSTEYLLNQLVPTNRTVLGTFITIRSIRTLASTMTRGLLTRSQSLSFWFGLLQRCYYHLLGSFVIV